MAPDDSDAADERVANGESDVTSRPDDESGAESDVLGHPNPDDGPDVDTGETGDGAADGDRDLPRLLDVRDDIDRIERAADADVSDRLDQIRARLGRFEEREDVDPNADSLATDVESAVTAMRTSLDGEADEYAESIQNRVEQYQS
jgi:hypothetical protein